MSHRTSPAPRPNEYGAWHRELERLVGQVIQCQHSAAFNSEVWAAWRDVVEHYESKNGEH